MCTVKSRSSHRRFYKRKGVLRNFSKFTGKHLCQSSFLIKLDFNLQLYFTKRFWHKCFSVNFPKFLRKHFLQNNSGRQLLQIHVTLCSTYLMNDKNYTIYFLTICFYRLCVVRLIYFCRFADFKLQRNKVKKRKFSFAVMQNFETEFIASLLYE